MFLITILFEKSAMFIRSLKVSTLDRRKFHVRRLKLWPKELWKLFYELGIAAKNLKEIVVAGPMVEA